MMLTFTSVIRVRPSHHDQQCKKEQAETCPLLPWSTQTAPRYEFAQNCEVNLVKLLS